MRTDSPSETKALAAQRSGAAAPTVREAVIDVLREQGLTTLFSNPGSTEIPFLVGLPDDLRFVLGLHEGAVVGMATGFALARGRPELVLLHTTAGLGNAVGALATARVNRAPLVVVVGQQDRRHLALEPFLAGRLEGLAGTYPVWTSQPVRAQDVPDAIARARHEASTGRGPALVIVPMDDWLAPADVDRERAAPRRVVSAATADPAAVEELAQLLAGARSPAIVVGAGADEPATREALVALAERLSCPVWQESFGARAGFPQDHPLFAGHLPPDRPRLREALAQYDAILVVGTLAFRQYTYAPGRLVVEGTRVAVVTEDPDEAHRSAAELAVLAPPGPVCAALVARVPARPAAIPAEESPAATPAGADEPLTARHVLSALAQRLPPQTILLEETPSSRPDLHLRVPASGYLGFVSAAMGGLGFALPAAIGFRMGAPERPVLAVTGDGSALYGIQSLWSAARYGVGALFVVLNNAGYAVLDELADRQGAGRIPWPSLDGVDVAALARGLSCPARSVNTYAELVNVLDEVLPTLAGRTEPLLLQVHVARQSSARP